ncbi:adenylyltransferase/cytidyltransferase family protein [Candidatus Giovannonibacteria bacterium]|nr:adenylyltransferase/cytidyltransferase family protein [Candidatus Giovannonibacteria bacterium]
MAPKKQHKMKKTVVYTYGVFDLFHKGHVELLKEAKALGDELIVGLFTDEVAESFKRKPVISLKDRMHLIQHCVFVDKIVVQKELEPDKIIKKLKPHILAKGPGAGWEENEEIPGEKTMKKIGGKVHKLGYHHGISTSQIIKKIQDQKENT